MKLILIYIGVSLVFIYAAIQWRKSQKSLSSLLPARKHTIHLMPILLIMLSIWSIMKFPYPLSFIVPTLASILIVVFYTILYHKTKETLHHNSELINENHEDNKKQLSIRLDKLMKNKDDLLAEIGSISQKKANLTRMINSHTAHYFEKKKSKKRSDKLKNERYQKKLAHYIQKKYEQFNELKNELNHLNSKSAKTSKKIQYLQKQLDTKETKKKPRKNKSLEIELSSTGIAVLAVSLVGIFVAMVLFITGKVDPISVGIATAIFTLYLLFGRKDKENDHELKETEVAIKTQKKLHIDPRALAIIKRHFSTSNVDTTDEGEDSFSTSTLRVRSSGTSALNRSQFYVDKFENGMYWPSILNPDGQYVNLYIIYGMIPRPKRLRILSSIISDKMRFHSSIF